MKIKTMMTPIIEHSSVIPLTSANRKTVSNKSIEPFMLTKSNKTTPVFTEKELKKMDEDFQFSEVFI